MKHQQCMHGAKFLAGHMWHVSLTAAYPEMLLLGRPGRADCELSASDEGKHESRRERQDRTALSRLVSSNTLPS